MDDQVGPCDLGAARRIRLGSPLAVISHNVDGVSHPTVKRRLPILDEHGLVERTSEKRGYYRVTERGRAYLAGDLDADDLEEQCAEP
nr:ArsR family transcriptional regulator [Halorubrum sp. 2020YC2]